MANLRAGLIGLGMMGRHHARVLASLWDVDDKTTRDLMARFVRAWWRDNSGGNRVKPRGKLPPAVALGLAQTALLAVSRHPYFLAGFQLVGAP